MNSFCVICALRRSHERINSQQLSPDLTRELKDLHRLSYSSLSVLLVVLTPSGSRTLLPVAPALLIYIISVRLAVSACFVQNHAALSKFLYVVPVLATLCVAAAELVIDMKSPVLAVIVLFLSVLPFLTIIFHHGRHCEEAPLPVRVQDSLRSIA